ncbi:cytochrome P450 [Streptomyces sp. LZ34]
MTAHPEPTAVAQPPTADATTPPPGCPAHAGAARLSGPRFQTEPARLYQEMRREQGPVAPVLLDGDVPAWLVLGYRELHQMTSDPVLFSHDSALWNQWDRIPADWPLRPLVTFDLPCVLYSDGPEHERRSGILHSALEGADPYELRDDAERFADRLIDGFCGTGTSDLIADYANLLPMLVLARTYGFADAEGPALATAINDMADGNENALPAFQHVFTSMQRLVADKRAAPAGDVVSRMLAHEGAAQYSDDEIVADLMVMTLAGHKPTADWIGNTLRLMLTDERFALSLAGGRHSVGRAMNGVLWEDTPLQNLTGRWATQDTVFGGQRIAAGDMLLLGLAAANTDPAIRPDEQVLTEGNQAFLSFSHGPHRCPYPAREIAETISKTAVEVLLDRLPDVRLAVPDSALVWRPSPFARGLAALPVEFAPAAGSGGGS